MKIPDDALTQLILDGSTYDKLRFSRWSWFKNPVPQKLRWSCLIILAVTLVPFLILVFPESVVAKDVTLYERIHLSPTVLVLGYFILSLEVIGALVMAGLVILRLRREPQMTDRYAEELLVWEDVVSLLSYGTGGIGALLFTLFFLLGLAGPDAITTFMDGGPEVFVQTGLPLDIINFAVVGVGLSAIVYTLSEYVTFLLSSSPYASNIASY